MAAPHLKLGPFDFDRAVGRGAMGEVWLARHRVQGVEVAIKLLHGTTVCDPWALEAFRNEVRAVADLEHAGIVAVVDHGIVPGHSNIATEGHFEAGTPYLVMEFVGGRPMNRFVGRLSWSQIRSVLLQLLDALAHSHARGVVHRDLKPGNVLLTHADGRLPSIKRLQPDEPLDVKLTDFGLAQAVKRHSAADTVVAGTPAYMAPEQLRGWWRDQGPWTDLYSVGCLAWAMATGLPPFGKDQPFEQALNAHLHSPPPSFRPKVAVPVGFEGWLRRLLAKRIEDRYPRAADAAWGLAQLAGQSARTLGQVDNLTHLPDGLLDPIVEDDVTVDDDVTELPKSFDEDDAPTEVTEQPTSRPIIVHRSLDDEMHAQRFGTPVPADWRPARKPVSVGHLFGVGLNLFGIRPPPMSGRHQERDALWQALREVYETGEGQAVILEGTAGMGRSRLGTWLCERADEVGAARVFTGLHDEEGGSTSGLPPMVSRYLRCTGLQRSELRARIGQLFPPGDILNDEVDGFATLLSHHHDDRDANDQRVRRFHYARERFSLVRRLIEREATGHSADDWEAVVIIWLDDAHLGTDTLDFCRFLLESQTADPVPLLLLISVDRDALFDPDRARAADVVDAISDHPRTRTIPLTPLPEDDHAQLVRALLGMDGELVEQVAARTAGNPLFAVQLVGEWVRQGLLKAGNRGFTLVEGAKVELPDDIGRVWGDRVERLLIGLHRKESQALELAAVLGVEVDNTEWKGACTINGLNPTDRLLGRLLAQRLASASEVGPGDALGFKFQHSMLREALLRRARRAGRLRDHHQACATMLQSRSDDRRGVAERLGRHLLKAGHVAPALGKLLDGARERRHGGEPAGARRLLDYRERALRTLDLPAADELWGLGWVERIDLDLEEGDPKGTEALLSRTEATARLHGWHRAGTHAAVLRGRLHLLGGDLRSALRTLKKARAMAEESHIDRLAGRAAVELGNTRMRLGHPTEALTEYDRATVIYERLGDRHGLATCLWNRGRVGMLQGKLDQANRDIAEARDLFLAVGARWGAAECSNGLGEVVRRQGDITKAETHYRRASIEMEAAGHGAATLPRLNLGVLLVQRRAHVEARRLIEPILRSPTVRSRPLIAVGAHLVLLAPAAAAADWTAWDHHLGRAASLLASTGIVDPDNAVLAILGAEEAVSQGALDRARSAYGLAWQQHEALGNQESLAQIEARVRVLS